jgi:geranylgeranyl diphosphate synthase type II
MTTQTQQPPLVRQSTSHFFQHRDQIEQEIAKSIISLGEKSKLRDACEYALTNGGKRYRPLIVWMIADALGLGLNVSAAALSVEFFHTASIIADDLPCMDNEDERRDKASLHKVYGESVALLASYTLITAAFQKIHENGVRMNESGLPYSAISDRACAIGLESAAQSGILATNGQYLDLFPPAYTLEAIKQVIYKKTISLFELSFVLGWVFGGGDLHSLEQVKKAAYHHGLAFQIADDIKDMHQDEKGKREMSIARFLGKERALTLFEEEMVQLRRHLHELNLYTPSFEKMCGLMEQATAGA